jgi:hypothetical protein
LTEDREKAAAMFAAFREVSEFVQRRMKDLEDVTKTEPAPATDFEARLEGLPWIEARSGKCDFVKDPPKELLDAIDLKDGFRGSRHHFTKAKDGTVIFRFARKGGGAA